MNRREFIAGLGAAAQGPLTVRAQQGEPVRRLGIIMAIETGDPQVPARKAALTDALRELGWTEGRNLRIDVRSGSGSDSLRKNIAELLALAPDVVLSSGTASLAPLLQVARTIPILFVNVADPVGAGYVESLAQPGGNATGFIQSEYSLSGKWPELLKQIAPHITRAAVLRDPTLTAGIGQFAVVQSVAPSLGLDVRPIDVRDAVEIERRVASFARSENGGLIVTAGASGNIHRERIISLAARYKLPAVYSTRLFAVSGGLLSYGPDNLDQYRQVATYVDRIFKGAKPVDLPVQAPTKYELVINLKTAKGLGLNVSASMQQRADEVIE
jgi:putative ABC transport system substrate-binding protein